MMKLFKKIAEKANKINTLYGLLGGVIVTLVSFSFSAGIKSHALGAFIEESNKNTVARNLQINSSLLKQLEKIEKDPSDLKKEDIKLIHDYKKYEVLGVEQLKIADFVLERVSEIKK